MPDRRLAILVTHPVQYFAPLFRRLAVEPGLELTVFYAHRPTPEEQGRGFGVAFEWDVDLTGGYDARFLRNMSANPSAEGYSGYDSPEIADIVTRERFDAFLVMGWHAKSYWQAIRACWANGTPLLVRGDSQLGTGRPSLRAWARLVTHRQFVPRFAACLAVGIRSEQYFRFYGARRIVRSPHFVDNEHFARGAGATNIAAVRAAWGVAEGALVVAFVGKLLPKKRPVDVLAAVASSGRTDVHVVFVGDGELREECRAAAARLGVSTTFAGFQNQQSLPAVYAAIDVLVLPSDVRETWGLVVNEAMACGRPAVVSSAAGCAPDLILEGETGFTFPVGDVRRLGERLDVLASDRDAVRRMGDGARRHVARYTVAEASAGVMEALEVAIARRAA
jgi:glycosyltransferase involved in cell wall biosynthesis